MFNILKNLYNGKLLPFERKEQHSKEFDELLRKIEEEEQYFTEKLSPEDSERFQKLLKMLNEASSSSEESLFSYAFSLGLLLGFDVTEITNNIGGVAGDGD